MKLVVLAKILQQPLTLNNQIFILKWQMIFYNDLDSVEASEGMGTCTYKKTLKFRFKFQEVLSCQYVQNILTSSDCLS